MTITGTESFIGTTATTGTVGIMTQVQHEKELPMSHRHQGDEVRISHNTRQMIYPRSLTRKRSSSSLARQASRCAYDISSGLPLAKTYPDGGLKHGTISKRTNDTIWTA